MDCLLYQLNHQTSLGWNYDDPLVPFDKLFGETREPSGSYYTNREVAALVDPSRPQLPYIWDDLSFEECNS